MHARAACRLEQLEYAPVYRYAPGKADWRAAGLRTEGHGAGTLRAHHALTPDVAVCPIDAEVSDAAMAARAKGQSSCLVVNDEGVVLGRLRGRVLSLDDHQPVQDVMEPGPTTIRPDDDLRALTERLHRRNVPEVIVTDPDGRLIGVVFRDRADEAVASGGSTQ